ncbi:methionine--tRNA ligase, cytoplasmic-like [Panulirus ornatus]|uniref:methionine--tRNA ligase, cytoplasmic-like n=1 Tax=Panulirus ornatus TaxID=150431 RepID=UPI003A87FDF3
MAAVNQELQNYITSLANNHQRDGLRSILAITMIGNQYIQENEPYKLIKQDRSTEEKEHGATVIAVAVNIVALVSIILDPYMPETAENIKAFLNNPPQLRRLPHLFMQFLPAGHFIQEPKPLITQIDDEVVQKLSKDFGGQTSSEKKPVSPAVIAHLDTLITEKGDKVRTMKASGEASKDEIGAEVAILLDLKKQLAIAQGIDPATLNAKNKKKKKIRMDKLHNLCHWDSNGELRLGVSE